MKKFSTIIWLSVVLLSLNGCATRIGLKDPISFAPSAVTAIPIHLGVVLTDGAENSFLKRRSFELLVGEAVKQNIGNSLQPLFHAVTVRTNISHLPTAVNNVAYVRFAPGTEFYLPGTIFQDSKVTVVVNCEVYDKTGKTLIWKTLAQGTKAGKQPPSLGLLTAGAINSFYRNLVKDSVQASLSELNSQISISGKEALHIQ